MPARRARSSNGSRLDALAGELRASGASALAVAGDARDEATARATVDAAVGSAGRLDILVNNAGLGNYKGLAETSADEYDGMMDTNMRSTFLFTRHAVPVMLAQRGGTILMLSSMAGVYGFAGEAVYCATKFAQGASSRSGCARWRSRSREPARALGALRDDPVHERVDTATDALMDRIVAR